METKKKNFSASWQSNQERMETGKKTFVPDLNQISNDWKRKKKTFVPDVSQISNDWKRKKLNLSANFHRCQTKCGYACSKCHVLVASRGEFSRMLIVA